ncbi:MAG: hypothetical protein QW228_03530 [Candidatus Aenigmatarchaeota archaeon]
MRITLLIALVTALGLALSVVVFGNFSFLADNISSLGSFKSKSFVIFATTLITSGFLSYIYFTRLAEENKINQNLYTLIQLDLFFLFSIVIFPIEFHLIHFLFSVAFFTTFLFILLITRYFFLSAIYILNWTLYFCLKPFGGKAIPELVSIVIMLHWINLIEKTGSKN